MSYEESGWAEDPAAAEGGAAGGEPGYGTEAEQYGAATDYGQYAAGTEADYAAASYPDERWDTAPVVEQAVSDAWDWSKQQASDAWDWATGPDESAPSGGGEGGAPGGWDEGAEGGPPSYGPSDAGTPGGVPDHAMCGDGACPTCAEQRQMSSGCVLESGHSGDHRCGYGDMFAYGATDIPGPPPLPKCRTVCSVCGQECLLTLGHDGTHGCGH